MKPTRSFQMRKSVRSTMNCRLNIDNGSKGVAANRTLTGKIGLINLARDLNPNTLLPKIWKIYSETGRPILISLQVFLDNNRATDGVFHQGHGMDGILILKLI